MTPLIAWLVYLAWGFAVVPLVFRARYGRGPFVLGRPIDRYAIIEYAYAAVIAAYTAALALGPRGAPEHLWAGLALMGTGALVQIWAVAAMGPHWRIGQDRADTTCRLVTGGPYRVLRHPIYASLNLISAGQAAMLGADARGIAFAAATLVYTLVQARAENRRWSLSASPA